VAERPIRLFGDPVLRSACDPIRVGDPRAAQLVEDLLETVQLPGRAGLAANQIGVSMRAFSYNVDDVVGYIINPVLAEVRGEVELVDEGCLSVPGERFELLRSQKAILRAVDLQQRPFEIVAEGWLARIFQHEYDHLDGVLYVDRLETGLRKTAEKAIKKARWGVPGHSWLPGEDDLEA